MEKYHPNVFLHKQYNHEYEKEFVGHTLHSRIGYMLKRTYSFKTTYRREKSNLRV